MAIPSYIHPNPAMRWMAWRRVEVIARQFRESRVVRSMDKGLAVLDFGCGSGVLFDEISQYADRLVGVDIVLDAAKIIVDEWALKKVTLLTPEEAEREIPENSVDIVVAAEVLEHVDPLSTTLDFLRTRLRTDGLLLVSLPTEGGLYRLGRRLAGFDGHYHHDNAASIHRQIVASGFNQERIEKIPLPDPLAIYWVVNYGLR